MKTNANDTANPMPIAANGQLFTNKDLNGDSLEYATGLTKREKFAMAAMQALITSAHHLEKYTGFDGMVNTIGHMSVKSADALIAALNGEV